MKPTILVVGEWPTPEEALAARASDAGYRLAAAPDRRAAISALVGQKPQAVLLGANWYAEPEGVGGLIEILRGDWRLHDVPLLAACGDSDDAVREAFRRGCDDVVASDLSDLAEKLEVLSRGATPPAPPRLGKSILFLDGSRLHRVVFVRLLSGAGYEVVAAETDFEAQALLAERAFDLALLDVGMSEADLLPLAEALTKRGVKLLGLGRPERTEGLKERVEALEMRQFFDKFSPPEDLLFLVNDLLLPAAETKRQSARKLWNEVVRFGQGRVGFSYNVNRTGLFIRTLAPPAVGAPLTLKAPAREGRDTLSATGRVAWVKAYVTRSAQTYPPGFGVAFEGLSPADESAWEKIYETL